MSERLSTTQSAYEKGRKEAMKITSKRPICPYGHTKIELVHWWWAGYNDCKAEQRKGK